MNALLEPMEIQFQNLKVFMIIDRLIMLLENIATF